MRNNGERNAGRQDRPAELAEDGLHHLTVRHCAATAEVVCFRVRAGVVQDIVARLGEIRSVDRLAQPSSSLGEREEPEQANARRDEGDVTVLAAAVHERGTEQRPGDTQRLALRAGSSASAAMKLCMSRCSARSGEACLENRPVVPNAISLLTPRLARSESSGSSAGKGARHTPASKRPASASDAASAWESTCAIECAGEGRGPREQAGLSTPLHPCRAAQATGSGKSRSGSWPPTPRLSGSAARPDRSPDVAPRTSNPGPGSVGESSALAQHGAPPPWPRTASKPPQRPPTSIQRIAMPQKLAVEPDHAEMLVQLHADRLRAAAAAFLVDGLGLGNEQDLPACASEPPAPVEVLAVHEVALIEQSNLRPWHCAVPA